MNERKKKRREGRDIERKGRRGKAVNRGEKKNENSVIGRVKKELHEKGKGVNRERKKLEEKREGERRKRMKRMKVIEGKRE